MKLSLFFKANKFFTNIFLYITLSISLTIFLVSITLYISFEKLELSTIYSSSKDLLSQISYSENFMTDTVKSLATQLYFNTEISTLFYPVPPEQQETDVILDRLKSYRSTMPMLHSIYIYNGYTGTFFTDLGTVGAQTKSDFYDQNLLDLLNNVNQTKLLKPIPRKINEAYSFNDNIVSSNVYTYVFTEMTSDKTALDRAVILNISESWMQEIINSLDASLDKDTFIINRKGITVCGNHKQTMLTDLSKESAIANVINSGESSGYFVDDFSGNKSLVAFVSSKSVDWIFVRITPYKKIIDKINNMKNITVMLCLLVLAIGLLFTYFTSKKIYKPIEDILSELKSTNIEKRAYYNHKKNEYIKNVLYGNISYTHDSMKNFFENLQIRLPYDGSYVILLFTIDHYKSFCDKYNLEDRNILKFGMINIISELCTEKSFQNETIEMGDDKIALLLNLSENNTIIDIYESINLLIVKTQKCIKDYLDISVTTSISSFVNCTFTETNSLYAQALNASLYRLFYGHGSIIFYKEINHSVQEKSIYSVQKEKLLIDSLLLGKSENVKILYDDIINTAKTYSMEVFSMTLSRLAFALNSCIDNIKTSGGSSVSFDLNSFIGDLNKLETIDEVNTLFLNMFQSIISDLKEERSPKHEILISKVIKIIETKYMDYTLSLDSISDMVDMSSAHLGRLFKKATSKSVADYINETRIERAKKLLETTNESINEILEKTGFSTSSNYFYLLFKKLHGMTPNEYRMKHTSSGT